LTPELQGGSLIALSVSPGFEFYADMNIPVMRTAMLDRIGFSEQAARVLVEDQQGINSLLEIRVQSDDKIESCPEERFLHATGPPLDPLDPEPFYLRHQAGASELYSGHRKRYARQHLQHLRIS
jgi:hypothetical protein